MRTTHPTTSKLGSYIPLVLITWLDFGGIPWEYLYLPNFFFKILDAFFKVKHYWPYLRNGWCDWCETKRMCISGILDQLCDLPLDLDLEFHGEIGYVDKVWVLPDSNICSFDDFLKFLTWLDTSHKNFWAFTGSRIEFCPDFADIRHGSTQDQSYSLSHPGIPGGDFMFLYRFVRRHNRL